MNSALYKLSILIKYKSKFLCISLIFLSACGDWIGGSKYQFSDGIYSSKAFRDKKQRVYVDNEEDSVFIYPIKRIDNNFEVDTSDFKAVILPQNKSVIALPSFNFRQNSFDIDFLTILIKVRAPAGNLPMQLNTNLNGAAYFGYRTDIYHLSYNETPLNFYNRRTTHFGFSFGGFLGIGSTDMNPSVTNNNINEEYEGFIITKGFAGIIGFNNFNIGLTLGFDTLPDKNKIYWIYQHKPWIGLALGLNLN